MNSPRKDIGINVQMADKSPDFMTLYARTEEPKHKTYGISVNNT